MEKFVDFENDVVFEVALDEETSTMYMYMKAVHNSRNVRVIKPVTSDELVATIQNLQRANEQLKVIEAQQVAAVAEEEPLADVINMAEWVTAKRKNGRRK